MTSSMSSSGSRPTYEHNITASLGTMARELKRVNQQLVELAEDFHEYKEEMKRFNHVIDQHMVETFSTEEVERIYYAYSGVNPREGEKYRKELRLLIKKRTGNARIPKDIDDWIEARHVDAVRRRRREAMLCMQRRWAEMFADTQKEDTTLTRDEFRDQQVDDAPGLRKFVHECLHEIGEKLYCDPDLPPNGPEQAFAHQPAAIRYWVAQIVGKSQLKAGSEANWPMAFIDNPTKWEAEKKRLAKEREEDKKETGTIVITSEDEDEEERDYRIRKAKDHRQKENTAAEEEAATDSPGAPKIAVLKARANARRASPEEMASILEKGKEKETSAKGVAAPKGQSENPTGSSSSDEPGKEGGDTIKRKRQTEEEETDKDKPAKAPSPKRAKTTIQGTTKVFVSGLTRKDMKPAAQYNIYPTNLVRTDKPNIWHITDLPDWSSVPHTNSALLDAIATGAALAAAASYNKEKVQIELRYEQPDRPFMKGKKKEIGFFIAYKK